MCLLADKLLRLKYKPVFGNEVQQAFEWNGVCTDMNTRCISFIITSLFFYFFFFCIIRRILSFQLSSVSFCRFHLPLNLSYITIYITNLFHLLTIFCLRCCNCCYYFENVLRIKHITCRCCWYGIPSTVVLYHRSYAI